MQSRNVLDNEINIFIYFYLLLLIVMKETNIFPYFISNYRKRQLHAKIMKLVFSSKSVSQNIRYISKSKVYPVINSIPVYMMGI